MGVHDILGLVKLFGPGLGFYIQSYARDNRICNRVQQPWKAPRCNQSHIWMLSVVGRIVRQRAANKEKTPKDGLGNPATGSALVGSVIMEHWIGPRSLTAGENQHTRPSMVLFLLLTHSLDPRSFVWDKNFICNYRWVGSSLGLRVSALESKSDSLERHKSNYLDVPTLQTLRKKAAQSLHFKGSNQEVESSSGIRSRLAAKFPKQVSKKNIPAQCYYTFQ
ncbi:hypothetical protein FPV67DRAFT_1453052 [Lyophyllum atratum]|nr:hypothetical protein FPV67DRAFT_1453052 [Lyophyllum atratum]